MLIWGNKKYVVDKIIQNNEFSQLKEELSELLWNATDIMQRWDHFRKKVKGFGPAMISELLCSVNPDEYMIWNRRALVGLSYLEVADLPFYNYQCTGKKYKELCGISKTIAQELKSAGYNDSNLLFVDYFIWDELQIDDDSLTNTVTKISSISEPDEKISDANEFIHNEIRDKIADIGQWLGFQAQTEVKVAEGSKVDTIWEATIGNMGRVIYVFEVQTKGNIDGLMINLLKSLNNPAVQGVVAVSDEKQLEKIKAHANSLSGLDKKLKYWDYKEVLKNHESLLKVNESINRLGLVPQGF